MVTLVPADRKKDILESNLLPLKAEIYDKDNYPEFLDARAEAFITYLDGLLV